MDTTTAVTKSYCNLLARQKGLDPAGHAGSFDDLVVLETPLPWKRSMYEKADPLPQALLDLYALWLEAYRAGHGYPHRALMVAPDAAYSRQGFRRVMFYSRPHPRPLSPEARGENAITESDRDSVDDSSNGRSGAFARYGKVEYLVPESELGALVWAWYQSRDELPRFDNWRDAASDATRDLLVCTHGTVDAACARFGYPLYDRLRKQHADEGLRVWRVSHFGGHVFAPTLMDMPTGHFWAYVEPPQAAQIVRRDGDVTALRGHYRGWAGMEPGFMQAAERELWQRYGWPWLDFRRAGSVRAQDEAHEEPQWADVQIEYTTLDGSVKGCYQARVEIRASIETISTTGNPTPAPYEQYVVTSSTLDQGQDHG